ncbi:N-acetyl-1-D-myo-inositol-2-amino-2-deoxy-alpha-D-glucopyranoside deacetylase [Rhodococcus sp. 27YEA15]|uniref:N-acetyl-1-D-myo-inositol-2-amino-2-deoxy-alpha- D-glucopyranoside deacetylase n=1 Tax=Rhodococcus sp. 27YEA15 TaxID=3156259 RepID=UPI003C7BA8FD
MSSATKRLLLVHAHPDDEAITTGGTIAKYAAEGVQVTVLTCTLGEEGEVIGDRWAGLVASESDQLGGFRIGELTASLETLGAEPARFLGGAGRYRDSGMVGTPSAANPKAFVNADTDDAVRAIADVIRELRPQVVITYDPEGGYGHPDHIQAYQLTTTAVAAAADPDWSAPGLPWRTSKLYWTVTEHRSLDDGLASIGEYPDSWRLPEPGELPSVDDSLVTTAIDVGAVMAVKIKALQAHATQLTIAPSGTEYALSNNVVQPILAVEHYVLVDGEVGLVDADGREGDLFSGVDV